MKKNNLIYSIFKRSILLIVFQFILLSCGENQSANHKTTVFEKYDGFCYGPFRENENPDMGVYPTVTELKEDLAFIFKFTNKIRTYGCTFSLGEIPAICDSIGLDCYIGAWIGKEQIENEQEIEQLLKIAHAKHKSVKGLVVGNEVVLRKDMSVEALSALIKKVNDTTDIPVGTAETWKVLEDNPEIAENADFIFVHIYPYWDGISIENSVAYVEQKYEEAKKRFPSKKVIIGETGCPCGGSAIGGAVPNEENQKLFFEQFTTLAKKNNIPFFYFSVFQETWKNKFEGKAGAKWGIFRADGSIMPLFKNSFSDEISQGIKRPARIVEKVAVNAPFNIYTDGRSKDNAFQPTGWMGDLSSLNVERDWRKNPHTGQSCLRLQYTPQNTVHGWAGIYFQYPINNWGSYPGYDASSSNIQKLTFWARGEKGGENAEFKTGGINRGIDNNSAFPYEDSYGPLSTGYITMTKEWKKYKIDLREQDLSNIIGGFVWVTNWSLNPKGCIIFLDDIKFE